MPSLVDLTGQKFGRLTIIVLHPVRASGGSSRWVCRCDCGKETVVSLPHLRTGKTRSCGCLGAELSSQRRRKDLTGQRFGRLEVIEFVGKASNRELKWLCQCQGSQELPHVPTRLVALATNLLSGHTTSCGCVRVEKSAERLTTRDSTRAIQKEHRSLSSAARKARVTSAFLGAVAHGDNGCQRTYFQIKRHVLGENTPDARSSQTLYCECCGAIFHRSNSALAKSVHHFCSRPCHYAYQKGQRPEKAVPTDLLPLMDPPTPPKERKRNPELLAIEAVVKGAKASTKRK